MTSPPPPRRGSKQEGVEVRLELTFPAEENRIAPVVDQVAEIAHQVQREDGKDMEIALALTEALANAVRHGSKNDPSKLVHCRVEVDAQRALVITVRDQGAGFDPEKVPSPLDGDGLSSDHGRGIHMIRQLMDEVRFEQNGTELHMKKSL